MAVFPFAEVTDESGMFISDLCCRDKISSLASKFWTDKRIKRMQGVHALA